MNWPTEVLLDALDEIESYGCWSCPSCGESLEPDVPCDYCGLEEPIHAAIRVL